MKKAYNVYSILGKTVRKAAMLTSVLALCFLFSGPLSAQSAPDAITDLTVAEDMRVSFDRLDPNSIDESAIGIVHGLLETLLEDMKTNGATMTMSEEMEISLRTTLLTQLSKGLKMGTSFRPAFVRSTSAMEHQFTSFNAAVYKGPSTQVIAENILGNFF